MEKISLGRGLNLKAQALKDKIIAENQKQEVKPVETSKTATTIETPVVTSEVKPVVDDKFLGMPKTTGIIVAVAGGIALLVGGYYLIKKLKK